jgi:ferrochelatase
MKADSFSNSKVAAAQERVGVLLVNLGTPDTADAKGVRVYLREFLSDPRVIEKQGLFWKLVLNGIILVVRPPRKARDYRKIWNTEKNESPLKTITRAQAEKLGQALEGSHIVVDWAMRYGNPSIRERMQALIAQGCERVLIVPLYPQYSAATTATVCDETARVLQKLRAQPAVRFAPAYPTDATYIEALATSITAHLATLSFKPEVIVASFHGMPQEYVDKGDPYYAQCVATTDALRARLGLDQKGLILTFQSRFGFDEWLQPYTDKTIEELAKSGVRRIAVVTPGFAADCLETLEEIAQENAEIFKHNGGEQFAFIPCLNDSEAGMDVIRQLVMRELQGWI